MKKERERERRKKMGRKRTRPRSSSSSSSKSSGLLSKIGKTIKKQAKSSVKSITKGAKIAIAAGGIARDLTDPKKMGKVAADALDGKGLIYPGSKYIGPGNAMNKGTPNSTADAAAFQHDKDYDQYLKDGHSEKRVYAGFSGADQRLMDRSDVTTTHGLATYGVMGVKKGLYKLGLTGKKLK